MHTLDDFDFDLPEELIALRPVRPRQASKMLVVNSDVIDATVSMLPEFLEVGDLLVFNNTKVIPARLSGQRFRETSHGSGVANIEVNLIERISEDTWMSLAKPAKRLKLGDVVRFDDLAATVVSKNGGEVTLTFDQTGEALDHVIEAIGAMPLPPYIASKRTADARDMNDYQTVFATQSGAVAAPTASLHFDSELLARLDKLGVNTTEVTLHVGAGTFLPVKVDNIEEHKMHSEWGEVSNEAAARINETLRAGGRVIPVGTTALRLIETAAVTVGQIAPWVGDTDIFIRPGYEFKIADGLMTNFHLPKSTLMMLVSALIGYDKVKSIYAHAIDGGYRFFSYGDSSLLFKK
ncbi:tRNA preQ1(34) S-adenosylmethionine ribosyltransferase-isomerase QueA [Rhodobacterales bacterium 52_120_T64]|nr:tRNA preQ1(34) S-adenosylmethionine ribosyltransferase-isomerase QueA [Rhodobacterales bacterium 52_120_T64]